METADPRPDLIATPELVLSGAGDVATELGPPAKRFEMLHFAFRNRKLVIGLSVVLFFLVLAVVGPWLNAARHNNRLYVRLIATSAGTVVAGDTLPALPASVRSVLDEDKTVATAPVAKTVVGAWERVSIGLSAARAN